MSGEFVCDFDFGGGDFFLVILLPGLKLHKPKDFVLILDTYIMAIRVLEFSNGGYKIRKIFA